MVKVEKTVDREKNKEDEVAKETSAKTPKIKLMKLAIISAGIALILGVGLAGWNIFLHKGGDAGNVDAIVEHEKKDTPGHIVTMEPFVINLADPNEIIYLKVAVNLEVESESMTSEIQKRMPQIRDAILMLLTSKTADDVKNTGGKLKLQDEMVERINHFLHTGKVNAVYFTEFVMQ